MLSLSDNLTHVLALAIVWVCSTAVIIFAPGVLDAPYVYSAAASLTTLILGYHLGNSDTPLVSNALKPASIKAPPATVEPPIPTSAAG